MAPAYSAMIMFPQAVAAILQAIERLARHTIVTCRQALQQIHFTSLTVLDVLSYHLQTGIEAVRGFWRSAMARVTKRARRDKELSVSSRLAGDSTFKSPSWKSGPHRKLKSMDSVDNLSVSSSGIWSQDRGGSTRSLASVSTERSFSSSSSFVTSTPR